MAPAWPEPRRRFSRSVGGALQGLPRDSLTHRAEDVPIWNESVKRKIILLDFGMSWFSLKWRSDVLREPPFLNIRFARDSAGTQTGQTRIVSCDRPVSTTIYPIGVCQ